MLRTTHTLILVAWLSVLFIPPAPASAAGADGFAAEAFQRLWTRTDSLVMSGRVNRSWIWGARAGERRYEYYGDAPGSARLVQYFDKARMELTYPDADPNTPWFVTNGLLVVELISGRVQLGDHTFARRPSAAVPVAGDLTNNPEAPTYAQLAPITSIDGNNQAPARLGARVSATYGPAGVGDRPELARPETEIVRYVAGHNVPRVFHAFMQASGPVIEAGRVVRRALVDPLFAFGHPITEPYWATVTVGGVALPVLFQAFERRVLTYTPSNPAPWQVEMGNVGQHYMFWRYGRTLRYAQPPFPAGIRTRETTLSIPTYDYTPALVATSPDDPIYPYPRLDRAQVGSAQERPYRAMVIENRFLELTLLPELGGRLYRAIDKTTGHNIFYQNPVIKPSPFGQRGWWLGVGGLEWAAPTEEHGYLEYLPWEVTLEAQERATVVRAATVEQQTGMQVTGAVALHPEEARFHVTMAVTNPTDEPHPLQMWTNAALSPGGTNRIGPGLRFVAPSDRMIVHATQDNRLPGPGKWIVWPEHKGRDVSRPANWTGYVGLFSPQPVSFLAAYDTAWDAGAAVVHGAGTVGAKLFGFSRSFDPSLYTDDGSDYVELWSGAQPTFWDYPPLAPGDTRAITADWLPLWGLGELVTASADAALGVTRHASGGLTVVLASARVVRGAVVVVRLDGAEIMRTIPLALRPDQPLAIDLPASGGYVQVEAPGLPSLEFDSQDWL